MPIIKSAKKRVRVIRKATIRNVKIKRQLREAIKVFQKNAKSSDAKKSAQALSKAQSAIDKAGKKNIMHKNKVARKQRQLATAAKVAGIKPISFKKKSDTKTVAKKSSPTKKSSSKKPTTPKKPTANKPTTKKPKKSNKSS